MKSRIVINEYLDLWPSKMVLNGVLLQLILTVSSAGGSINENPENVDWPNEHIAVEWISQRKSNMGSKNPDQITAKSGKIWFAITESIIDTRVMF
jgi:hypothetical protein